ncbi:ribonuclease III [Albimonas sp. CAU 1670]|uniref:ribonuclease III n=1 Tax=Albimonas sp. CAU 1670 TaxID=3032599 RepID=UPI0023D9AFF7|nr:ribonuclease III [Albimonas sp. CAU 1670]MDF2232293.1 ribonuclease III [Albimonas sp. CAU 1670]
MTVHASVTLEEALTHPSASSSARPDNQRLEFLGDRVLGLVISQAVFEAFPDAPEGQLAPRFNALVRKETCAEVAETLNLGAMLRLGRSETLAGGRRRPAVLGDAMEAVIAAIYLDNGMDDARAAILTAWGDRIRRAERTRADAKTAVQEWAQARGLAPPTYVERGRSGPDHAPLFTIAARMADGVEAEGAAASKRAAQQEAAKALLAILETRT